MNAKRLTRSRASWRRAAATVVASAVEGLEPRRLLSTVTSTDLDVDGNPDLVITGTGGADTVNVYLNPHQLLGAQTIVQDVTTGKVYGFLLPFEAIEAHMLGGDDRLNVYVFDEYDEVTQGIHVDMGSGKDKFTFSSPILANSPATTPNAADGANLGDDINSSGDTVDQVTSPAEGADLYCTDLLLDVTLGSGDDCADVDLTRTSLVATKFKLNVHADSGNDTVNLLLPSQRYGEAITAGECEAPLEEGSVSPQGEIGTYVASQLIAKIDTGTATTSNTVNVTVPTFVAGGSTAKISVEGNANVDKVNAYIGVKTVNYNVFANQVDGNLIQTNSLFSLDANLYGGNDQMTAYMDYSTGLQTGSVTPAGVPDNSIQSGYGTTQHYGFNGGTGDDSCKFFSGDALGNRYTTPQSSNTLLGLTEFVLKGGSGKDQLFVDLDTASANADSTIHLGTNAILGATPGKIRILLNGDAGDDKLEIDMNVDVGVISGNLYPVIDWAENGGDGQDKVILAANVGNGVLYAGPLKAVRMDGGNDKDTWDVDGNVVNKRFSLETEDNTLEGDPLSYDNT